MVLHSEGAHRVYFTLCIGSFRYFIRAFVKDGSDTLLALTDVSSGIFHCSSFDLRWRSLFKLHIACQALIGRKFTGSF